MPKDYPFYEVAEKARAIIEDGIADVYQKFTCAGCGQRLTIEEPNKFYLEGTCDQCSVITNIELRGCNYLVHFHGGHKQ